MFGVAGYNRYRRPRYGYGRRGNFFLPFTLGALTGAILTPPYRYYPYPYPYYPYPNYPYPYY